MSYILNALRKSEQERQAIEPDSIANRINVHQPQRYRNSTWLIAVLIVSNLAIVAYFLGFNQTTPSAPGLVPAVAPVLKPVEVTRPDIIPAPPPVTLAPEPKTPAIAEIVEARSAAATPVPSKTAAVKKPLAALDKPTFPPPLVVQPNEPPRIAFVKQAPLSLKNDLPFVDDLPADVHRSLPNITINVFGYSSVPSQRFVMIDMVKYVPGQRIKDQLELKEIREDSIVVGYEDLTFKIKRP